MLLEPYKLMLIIVFALIAGVLLYRYLSAMIRRAAMKRRFRRGAAGERSASHFLKRHGYRILEEQAHRKRHILVDGKLHFFDIRADFITQKRGIKYLIEVKTGEKAVDPVFTDTRRQLLEYAVSFDVDKICLFDAEEGSLREIGLPMVRIRYRDRARMFLAGAITGIAVSGLLFWLTRLWRD